MQGQTVTAAAAASQSGGGGHHKCSKCNWPYANPHPSAKQRRHHKKVCGKVAGYVVAVSDEDDKQPLNVDDTVITGATVTDDDNSKSQLNGSDVKQQQQEEEQHLPDENQQQQQQHPDENQNEIEIKDGEEKSNGKEMDRWLSTKSEEDVFSDATTDFSANPLSRTNSIIQQPNGSPDDSQSQSPQASGKVDDRMDNGRKEDLASSSDVPSLVDSTANTHRGVSSENTHIGENITEVKQVSEKNGDDLVEILSSAIDSAAGKISCEESEIDSNSEMISGIMEREISADTVDATPTVLVTGDADKEAVMDSEVSQAKISADTVDATPTVLVTGDADKEAVMDSEVSQAKISPSHDGGCIVRELSEVLVVPPENAHVDVKKLSEVTVEDCEDQELLKQESGLVSDCSKVTDDTELHGSNNEEAHLGSSKLVANTDFIVGEEQVDGVNLQGEEESSKMMVQEVPVESQADNAASTDTVNDGIESLPDAAVGVLALSQTNKDEIDSPLVVQELHCDQQDQSNNMIPEAHLVVAAGADSIPSPSDAVNHLMPDDAVREDKAKVDDPSVSVTSLGVATVENFPDPTEKSPADAVCPSEAVENLIYKERNLDYSGESEAMNSEVKELMAASLNGKVDDTNVENSVGEPSDDHSRSLLVEEGNSIVKQQSDSLVVEPLDRSNDTNSQTDSVEANWGSVSESFSLKDLGDVQGTNTPVSMEAVQGTDSQQMSTDRFEPRSVTSLVKPTNEEDLKSASYEIQTLTAQGEKKNESAKLSLDSGKTHSTSLRSLLGSIVESKKVKAKQNDDGQLPKAVKSTPATDMKSNQQKEWDSPARLPVTMNRERKKVKQWVPFMCCSSAVNLKTQS